MTTFYVKVAEQRGNQDASSEILDDQKVYSPDLGMTYLSRTCSGRSAKAWPTSSISTYELA